MFEAFKSILHKAFVLFAVGLLLGFGLCGLDYLLASHGIGKSHEEFGVGPLDGLSLFTMGLSFLGLVLTFVVWIVTTIVGAITNREPTHLFDRTTNKE